MKTEGQRPSLSFCLHFRSESFILGYRQWSLVIANRPQIFLVQVKVQYSLLQCEDNQLTILLSDSEEGPPKLKKKTLTGHFALIHRTPLPFGRTVPRTQPTSNASARSTDAPNPGPSTRSSSPDKTGISMG